MTDETNKKSEEGLPESVIEEVEKTIDDGKNVVVEENNTTTPKALSELVKDKKLDFPCDYQVSVMGANNDEFKTSALATVRKYVPELKDSDIDTVVSSGDKYSSLRIHFTATSQEQLDKLYAELGENKLVKWAL